MCSSGGIAPMEVDRFEKGKSKGKQKGNQRVRTHKRVKGNQRATRAKAKVGNHLSAVPLRVINVFIVENMDISNVIAGSFMANLMGRA